MICLEDYLAVDSAVAVANAVEKLSKAFMRLGRLGEYNCDIEWWRVTLSQRHSRFEHLLHHNEAAARMAYLPRNMFEAADGAAPETCHSCTVA